MLFNTCIIENWTVWQSASKLKAKSKQIFVTYFDSDRKLGLRKVQFQKSTFRVVTKILIFQFPWFRSIYHGFVESDVGSSPFFLEAPWPSHLPQEVALINIFMGSTDRRFVLKRQTYFFAPKVSFIWRVNRECIIIVRVPNFWIKIFLPLESHQLQE